MNTISSSAPSSARGLRNVLGLAIAGISLVCLPNTASAIPAFARKYRTSCQTCHVAFPQLTPFGEAFRLNGYRFPEGLDEDYAKVPEVPLGAEGYKKLFPRAVWPTTLTAVPPVSLLIAGEATYTPNTKVLDRPATSFNELSSSFELLTGGAMGDSISYFGELEFATPSDGDDVTEEVAVERLWATYHFFDDLLVNLKVGFFEPGIMTTSQHRRLNRSKYLVTKQARPGDNDFSFEGANRGVEAYGILPGGRAIYNVGVIEGNRDFEPISRKDVYVRLGYKLGGLRLDGVAEDSDALVQNPRPWAERSLMFSIYGLNGASNIDDGGDGNVNQFNILGGDIRAIFEDATITVGANIRQDDDGVIPTGTPNPDRVTSSNIFVEGQYVVLPWLIPSVRYENFNQSFHSARERVDVTVTFLIRANVKATLFYVYDTSIGNDDEVTGDNNNILGTGLELGF